MTPEALSFSVYNSNGVTKLSNLVDGEWVGTASYKSIVDPLDGKPMVSMPDTGVDELPRFVASMRQVSKTGLHNPLKNVSRYVKYGEVSFKMAVAMSDPVVENHFVKLIQRTCPKSDAQARGEARVVREFLKNFSGDQPRFMFRGFHVSGDRDGQESAAYRFPYGAVMIVAPFNFPLEIPALQLMGALYAGNHVTIKAASTTSLVLEEFIRLMLSCGAPSTDVNLIHCSGSTMLRLVKDADPRLVQFTGGNKAADELTAATHGKVRLEDAGFDWKLLGPDVASFSPTELEYIASQCDQDAYACGGQKCSKQSILFVPRSVYPKLVPRLAQLASKRNIADLTNTPLLSVKNAELSDHVNCLLTKVKSARLLFGGKPLDPKTHSVPPCYGSFEPTAVEIPIESIQVGNRDMFRLITSEMFGPFQVIVPYGDDHPSSAASVASDPTPWKRDADLIVSIIEGMTNYLTAGIVTKDQMFENYILAHTINGTTYSGLRARTTGAPQNHWFGPAGDPRAAGIGSPEAIIAVWTCHREIVRDIGHIPSDYQVPKCT